MSAFRLRRQPAGLAMLLAWACLLPAGCADATGDPPMDQPAAVDIELLGDGPFDRFIVRYRTGSPAGEDPAVAAEQLRRTAAAAGLAADGGPSWQRRLAVGGDVFVLARPLEREAALRLMRAFAADPQVESIEVDRRLGIDPRAGPRMRER